MSTLNLVKLMIKARGLMTLHLLKSLRVLSPAKIASVYQQLCCFLFSYNSSLQPLSKNGGSNTYYF